MILAAPLPEYADFEPAVRENVDRAAMYCVETNTGEIEVWPGELLHMRLRPEFVVGRAVVMSKIEPGDYDAHPRH